MTSRPFRYAAAVFLPAILAAAQLAAADSGSDPTTEGSPLPSSSTPAGDKRAFQRIRSWSDSQLRWLYDNIVVDPQNRNQFKVKPEPHIRDLVSSDYSRLDLRMFYGFDRRIEGELAFGNYFPSPWKHGDRVGVAYLDAVARYRWIPHADPTGRATAGVEAFHPIGDVPKDLSDGVNRYTAFCSYARASTRIKNFQEFLNLSYTVITASEAIGTIADDEPQDDFFSAGGGFLRNIGRITYGISLAWDHTTGEHLNFVTVTPSLMFDVPAEYTSWLPGQWQVGASYSAKRYRDVIDTAFRLRVRWLVGSSELKRFFGLKKKNRPPN